MWDDQSILSSKYFFQILDVKLFNGKIFGRIIGQITVWNRDSIGYITFVLVDRYPGARISLWTVSWWTDVLIHRCPGRQISRWADVLVDKCPDVMVDWYPGVQIHWWTEVFLFSCPGCTDVLIQFEPRMGYKGKYILYIYGSHSW